MPAQILEGKALSVILKTSMRERITAHTQMGNRPPGLAVILIGVDPASQIYIRNKRLACKETGIYSRAYDLPDNTSESDLIELIHTLNTDPSIDGILVQLPLPTHMTPSAIIDCIDPTKDVDGFHPYNLGRLAQKRPLLRPCTPAGIMRLLEETGIPLKGLDALVIGTSNIVGQPMILELLQAKCTVTGCHRATQDLASHVRRADLLVVAAGHPRLVPGHWIKPGAIVIDVGMHRLPQGGWTGDVDFETAQAYASWITPVPGGVGPMTVAMLLHNTLDAYEADIKR